MTEQLRERTRHLGGSKADEDKAEQSGKGAIDRVVDLDMETPFWGLFDFELHLTSDRAVAALADVCAGFAHSSLAGRFGTLTLGWWKNTVS